MSIWKALAALGSGVSLLLIASAIAQYRYQDQMLTVIAGISAANFALLAIIADKLSAK